MRAFDRALTGIVLFIAAAEVLSLAALFFLFLGKGELDDRQKWLPASERIAEIVFSAEIEKERDQDTTDGSSPLWIQGNIVQQPRGKTSLICPMVLKDGSLDPRHEFRWGGDGSDKVDWARLWQPNMYSNADLRRRLREPEYNLRRTSTMSYGTAPCWIYSPELGIIRIGKDRKIEGSLTEEGWVAGRQVPSPLTGAVFRARVSGTSNYRDEYSATQDRILLYVRAGAVYRADLENRRIEKLGPVQVEDVAFLMDRERPLAYVLASDRIYWIEMKPHGTWGSFDAPVAVAGVTYAVFWPEEADLILRAEIPGSRTPTSVRYKVVVCAPTGEIRRKYEYEFAIEGGLPFLGYDRWHEQYLLRMRPGPFWEKVMTSTMGGIVCTALIPPAGRPMVEIGKELLNRMFLHPRDMKWQRLIIGPAWPGWVVSIALGLFACRRARPHHRTWLGPVLWAVFVGAFGVIGFLVWLCLGGRSPIEACAKCAHRRSACFAPCPACGAPRPAPERLGIEILRPVQG